MTYIIITDIGYNDKSLERLLCLCEGDTGTLQCTVHTTATDAARTWLATLAASPAVNVCSWLPDGMLTRVGRPCFVRHTYTRVTGGGSSRQGMPGGCSA